MTKTIFLLLLLYCSSNCFAQYYVDIDYYIELEDRFITVTDTLYCDDTNEANEQAFSLFMQSVSNYDCDYLMILYNSKEEKYSLKLPYNYHIYCENGDVKLFTRYSLERLHKRLKDDYWGRTITRLKGISKKKKTRKEVKSRKTQKVDNVFEPVRYF